MLAREDPVRQGALVNLRIAYLVNWLVETMIPLHSNMMRPVNATATRNLVRVKTTRTALHGGKRALADFHVTPPLGNSILSISAVCRESRKEGKDAAASATRKLDYASMMVIERV